MCEFNVARNRPLKQEIASFFAIDDIGILMYEMLDHLSGSKDFMELNQPIPRSLSALVFIATTYFESIKGLGLVGLA